MSVPRPDAFQHEVLTYEGTARLGTALRPFIEDGLDRDEAILVVVTADKIPIVRGALGAGADRVIFAPMDQVGRNPARIIPAWREFLDRHLAEGRAVRGVGEPIFAARSEDELDECHRHEALLNRAFGDGAPWRLLCPYDVTSLDPSVVKQAHENHPLVTDGLAWQPCRDYRAEVSPFGGALREPPADHVSLSFVTGPLERVRALVASHAAHAGLENERLEDLLLAVNEVATNSLRHGGGEGLLRVWRDSDAVVCQVSDQGRITDPLIGRRRPPATGTGGRGVWLANQLCDLVQIRSTELGTTVRLRMSLLG